MRKLGKYNVKSQKKYNHFENNAVVTILNTKNIKHSNCIFTSLNDQTHDIEVYFTKFLRKRPNPKIKMG